jgi:hypothetical protein
LLALLEVAAGEGDLAGVAAEPVGAPDEDERCLPAPLEHGNEHRRVDPTGVTRRRQSGERKP